MDIKQQFIKLLQQVKKELIWEFGIKQLQFLLLFASMFTVAIFLLARFFVMMNITVYVVIGLFVLLVTFLYKGIRSSPGIQQAAELYDCYSKEERATTALSFIHETDAIYELQRQDALTFMKKSEPKLNNRKQTFLHPMPLLVACLLFTITTLFIIFPNEKMTEAKNKKAEIKVVKEVKKELEKKAQKQQDETVKKSIEDTLEQLEATQKAEDALQALIKQKNELELKKIQSEQEKQILEQSINQLKGLKMNALAQAIEAGDKSLIKDELIKLQDRFSELSEAEKETLAEILGDPKELSKEQLAVLEEKLLDLIDGIGEANNLSLAQNQILESAQDLQQMMKDLGIDPSIDLNELLANANNQTSPTPPQTGNGEGLGANGDKANGGNQPGNTPYNSNPGGSPQPGSGSNPGSGSGSTPGNGSGSTPGSGAGSGTGGTSQGNGIGPGAGKGMGSRELTIPETTDGQINIERDHGALGKGSPTEQREGHGPLLKGSVRPYEQVYNEYEKASRESVNRMQLPTELENIVKGYFSKIKPN